MIRLVADDTTNPIAVMKKLNIYTGQDVQLSINGSANSCTVLKCSSTGESASDELSLEVLWKLNADDFQKLYDKLRSAINKQARVKIGRYEFLGRLVDTTKLPANADLTDSLDGRFELIFSEVTSANTTAPTDIAASFKIAKKHSSSIVELIVPDDVWERIKENVPGSKDLKDLPHITLVYLPDVKKTQVEEIKDVLQRLTAEYRSMQINVTGIDAFPANDKKMIPYYAKIESPALYEFREELIEALQEIDPAMVDLETFPEFVPHICVQYVKEKDDNEIRPLIKPISWMSRFASFSFKGDKKWVFPFGLTNEVHRIPYEEELQPGSELDAKVAKILGRVCAALSSDSEIEEEEEEELDELSEYLDELSEDDDSDLSFLPEPDEDLEDVDFDEILDEELEETVGDLHTQVKDTLSGYFEDEEQLEEAVGAIIDLLAEDDSEVTPAEDMEDDEEESLNEAFEEIV